MRICRCFLLGILLLSGAACAAQCGVVISSFPYRQGFEANDGDWQIQGTSPSWAWGTPAKPVINRAAEGGRCWVTGGLTGGNYNNGEQSWLLSPCFDFSDLPFPYISFSIWWETEKGFDGCNLQYSTDNGLNWTNVGFSTDKNCLDSNWYNTPSVRFLGPFGSLPEGWSGSRQGDCVTGDGSNGWLTAKHVLTGLGGQPSVRFRFTFGAGTQCNNYDGVGIDDIQISNAPLISGAIAYNCENSNTVSFNFETAQCPVRYRWNFDDPTADADSVSDLPNPQHVFSLPGSYQVIVTVSSPGVAPFTAAQQVNIISANAQVVEQVSCNGGATGSATVAVVGNPGPFTYQWNSVPEQNSITATGLLAGTYTVAVNGEHVCPQSASVTLAFDSLQIAAQLQQPGCLYNTGAIRLRVSGGIPPYSYSWLPNVSSTDSAINLANGNYSVLVTDSRPCSRELGFSITTLVPATASIQKIADAGCNGSELGSAKAILVGGTAPFSYLWQTQPLQRTDTACCLSPGRVSLQVTDSNGCRSLSDVVIGLQGICNDVFFSNSFSPNGDGRNEGFGPLGNVLGISRYQLHIYNRYGQPVFASNNPLLKWDGQFKGKLSATGVYVWRCSYWYNNQVQRNQKGTVLLMR